MFANIGDLTSNVISSGKNLPLPIPGVSAVVLAYELNTYIIHMHVCSYLMMITLNLNLSLFSLIVVINSSSFEWDAV